MDGAAVAAVILQEGEGREAALAIAARLAKGERTYFVAHGSIARYIFGEALDPPQGDIFYAHCFSNVWPSGETGSFRASRVIRLISEEEFARAKEAGWDVEP